MLYSIFFSESKMSNIFIAYQEIPPSHPLILISFLALTGKERLQSNIKRWLEIVTVQQAETEWKWEQCQSLYNLSLSPQHLPSSTGTV